MQSTLSNFSALKFAWMCLKLLLDQCLHVQLERCNTCRYLKPSVMPADLKNSTGALGQTLRELLFERSRPLRAERAQGDITDFAFSILKSVRWLSC